MRSSAIEYSLLYSEMKPLLRVQKIPKFPEKYQGNVRLSFWEYSLTRGSAFTLKTQTFCVGVASLTVGLLDGTEYLMAR